MFAPPLFTAPASPGYNGANLFSPRSRTCPPTSEWLRFFRSRGRSAENRVTERTK
jgi:hypothetical protein